MNCKNCNEVLENNAHFCDNCGAKVIKNRITFRFLLVELFASMGFESLYFITLKKMFTAPQDVIKEYLGGIRKRYVNPFAFIAVGAALSLLIFNYFSDDYMKMQSQSTLNKSQIEELKKTANIDLSKAKDLSDKEFKKLKRSKTTAQRQLKFIETWAAYVLKYFNIVAFLFLPFYALISKLTYFKPYNYGEHIVINAYVQGATMYVSIIAFVLSMLINPNLFMGSMLFVVAYYLYIFSKLHNIGFGKSLLKLLRFILVLIVSIVLLMLIGFLLMLLVMLILKFLNPELLKSIFEPS